jgi:hypothetical protein
MKAKKMANVKCKHCGQTAETGRSHNCPQKGKISVPYQVSPDDGDFLISMVIGAATDSALIGGGLGGSFTGGIIGDLLDGDLFD